MKDPAKIASGTRRRWRLPAAVVAVLATAGFVTYLNHDDAATTKEVVTIASRAPSPLSMGNDSPAPQAQVAPEQPPTQGTQPAPQGGTSPDERFMQLASSANPRDRAVAYDMAHDCMVEAAILAGPMHVQVHPLSASKCKLAQGHWQDTELRKKLIAAKADRAEFGAYQRVVEERFQAFADDPQAFKDLLQRAYTIGIENAEPIALMSEASMEKMRGDAYGHLGWVGEAKESYEQALVYTVAAAINAAKVTGRTSVDVSKEPDVVDIAAKLDHQSAETAIEQGRKYAEKWNEELVRRALGRQ